MKKKIAVIVRERQAEALRMAVGLTFRDDEVHVFIMDRELAADASIARSLEALRELGVPLYTNLACRDQTFIETAGIAALLAGFHVVLPY